MFFLFFFFFSQWTRREESSERARYSDNSIQPSNKTRCKAVLSAKNRLKLACANNNDYFFPSPFSHAITEIRRRSKMNKDKIQNFSIRNITSFVRSTFLGLLFIFVTRIEKKKKKRYLLTRYPARRYRMRQRRMNTLDNCYSIEIIKFLAALLLRRYIILPPLESRFSILFFPLLSAREIYIFIFHDGENKYLEKLLWIFDDIFFFFRTK